MIERVIEFCAQEERRADGRDEPGTLESSHRQSRHVQRIRSTFFYFFLFLSLSAFLTAFVKAPLRDNRCDCRDIRTDFCVAIGPSSHVLFRSRFFDCFTLLFFTSPAILQYFSRSSSAWARFQLEWACTLLRVCLRFECVAESAGESFDDR